MQHCMEEKALVKVLQSTEKGVACVQEMPLGLVHTRAPVTVTDDLV